MSSPASNVYNLNDRRPTTPEQAVEVLEGEVWAPVARASRMPVVRAHAARAGTVVARQTLRVVHPLTVARVAVIMGRGAGRIVVGLMRFAAGADLGELKSAKPEKHLSAVKTRWWMLGTASAIGYVVVATNPAAAWIVAGVAAVACAALGNTKQGPILAGGATILPGTDTLVRDAFVHVRLAKTVEDIKLVAPIQRHDHGWCTKAQLPPGVAASKAVALRDELASALGVPTQSLTVTPDQAHGGRVELRTSTRSNLDGAPIANPLVRSPQPVDLWEPLPVGVDEQGQTVSVKLVSSSMLVGGAPDMGKSVLCANVLVGGLMDPHCDLWLVDGKGLDSRPLIPHAARHVGPDFPAFADLMDELEGEMDRRYDRLARLEVDKLSREISQSEMPLILLSIDELARYSGSKDKDARRGVETLRNIVSVGRACGIIPLLATQKPSSKIVPTDLRDLIKIRAAVMCTTRAASNTILGDDSPVSATDLPAVPGAAWLRRAGTAPVMFRPYLVDGPALRIAAAGVPKAAAPAPIIRVLEAMGGAEKMPSAVLAEALGTTAEQLADMLRPYGVRPRQLGGEGNLRGYRKADIQAAT